MSLVTADLAVSLDGFTAGPGQCPERPSGTGADVLTAWMLETDRPGRGGWDGTWTGWWGDEPPYHSPVFVLTHHERAPLEMAGGTTFHFVTDGIEAALERARDAAGGEPVEIAGGASTVRQHPAAGLLDELVLHVVPAVIGAGERLFDGPSGIGLEPVEVIASPTVTHLRYRISR